MHKAPPRSVSGRLLAAGSVVCILGITCWWLRHPAQHPHTDTADPEQMEAPQQHPGSYHNRAIWRPLEAPQQAERAQRTQGLIYGHIYDTDGTPLGGARLVATTYEQAGNVPSVAGTALSAADGRFEIPLQDGAYQVNASLKGYGPASAVVRGGDEVSLVLPQSGLVRGKVSDEAHHPVGRFVIEVISVVPANMPAPAPLWSRTFESADGKFEVDELPAWPVVIKASAMGYAAAFSSPLTVKPKEERPLELTVPVGCALAGRVEDKNGAPVPFVMVNAESRLIAGSGSEMSMQSANQVQSDTDGRFRLEHVPTGAVSVRAYDGDHAVTTVALDVASCDKAAPVKLVLSAGSSVSGVARDGGGKPIPGGYVSLASRTTGFVVSRTDAQGRFRFQRIPPGNARLELHHEGQRTLAVVQVKDGEELKRDLVLFTRGKGELRGRITAHGRPLSGARLLVASGHGHDGVDTYYPITGADGTYSVPSLGEGLYLVSVISTMQAQGTKVTAGGVVTVDLDVSPQEEQDDSAAEPDEEPAQSIAPAAQAGAGQTAAAAAPAAAAPAAAAAQKEQAGAGQQAAQAAPAAPVGAAAQAGAAAPAQAGAGQQAAQAAPAGAAAPAAPEPTAPEEAPQAEPTTPQ